MVYCVGYLYQLRHMFKDYYFFFTERWAPIPFMVICVTYVFPFCLIVYHFLNFRLLLINLPSQVKSFYSFIENQLT
jgi:hypothetical protein